MISYLYENLVLSIAVAIGGEQRNERLAAAQTANQKILPRDAVLLLFVS